jgi:hypothetical protein
VCSSDLDHSVQTNGQFGNEAIVSFPEARWVKGFSFRLNSGAVAATSLAIEGKFQDGNWTRLFEASGGFVNQGRYGALTNPMFCTAVRVLTNSTTAVQSCQFFDAVPLVPMSMTSNTAPATAGVRLIPTPASPNLFRCFTEQVNVQIHGTAAWYYNGGDWRSNRGMPPSPFNTGDPDTPRQNRFEVHFDDPQTVCGFSVGGLATHQANLCYANCLLIEGRVSESDFWLPLSEVEFDPAERRTQYFDFAEDRTVGQLRITVQDITHGTGAADNTEVRLLPMQIYGT